MRWEGDRIRCARRGEVIRLVRRAVVARSGTEEMKAGDARGEPRKVDADGGCML